MGVNTSHASAVDAQVSAEVIGREPQTPLAIAAARGARDAPAPRHIKWLLAPAIRAGPPARHRHLVRSEAPGECVHAVKEKRRDQHEVRDGDQHAHQRRAPPSTEPLKRSPHSLSAIVGDDAHGCGRPPAVAGDLHLSFLSNHCFAMRHATTTVLMLTNSLIP